MKLKVYELNIRLTDNYKSMQEIQNSQHVREVWKYPRLTLPKEFKIIFKVT